MKLHKLITILFITNFIVACDPSSKETVINDISEKQIEIRIIDNTPEFVDKSTDFVFTPMGYNYVHIQNISYEGIEFQSHSTFSIDHYKPDAAQQMLSKMENAGFNTVRVFMSPASLSNNKGEINSRYVENIVDFMNKADEHNIFIILTTDMIPLGFYQTEIVSEQDIQWLNTQYIDQRDINLEVDFWQTLIIEFIEKSAPLNVILSYELRNEFFFNPAHHPFDNVQSVIKHPNGIEYDLSDESQKLDLINDSFLYWSSTVRNAILDVDENALISVGFFAPELLGTPSHVAILKSELDFIDVHLYSSVATLPEYVDYFKLDINQNKPIIMGEFGQVDSTQASLLQISDDISLWKEEAISKYKINGWLLWTWDTQVGVTLSVPDDNDIIFNKLSPFNNDD